MLNNIRDSKKRITSYGLSCGYVERYETDKGNVILWKEYEIIRVDRMMYNQTQYVCEEYTSIKEARKAFTRAKKLLK